MMAALLSPKAAFITGQNFFVDGGMTKKRIYEHGLLWPRPQPRCAGRRAGILLDWLPAGDDRFGSGRLPLLLEVEVRGRCPLPYYDGFAGLVRMGTGTSRKGRGSGDYARV